MSGKRIEVRATINLSKLSVGRIAEVNPDDPYIRALLNSGKLVPTSGEWPPREQPEQEVPSGS